MNYKDNLLYILENYSKDGLRPFHMPGHKRNELLAPLDAYRLDITEIDNFDDLHHPEGLLKEAMERAGNLFGSRRTFFMVNGCTGGILASIFATCEPGDSILVARNSHKSVYNAINIRKLNPLCIWPKGELNSLPLGVIPPEDVDKALTDNPDIKCVFITSPTYEGVVSDVRAIADIAHKHGAVLIVDEAHGAHMHFNSIFPEDALSCGADIVIHGIHKTLPALTQSALLHIGTANVNESAVSKYLSIFQSSSPSYILMGGIDYAMDFLEKDGEKYYEEYARQLKKLYNRLANLNNLEVLPYSSKRDASKIVISCKKTMNTTGFNGHMLYNNLREKYNLQPEMSLPHYVIMMTSVWDQAADFEKLYDAIICEDRMCDSLSKNDLPDSQNNISELHFSVKSGDLAEDMVYVYPPGIPLIIAGETYTSQIIDKMRYYIENGYLIKSNTGILQE